MLNDDRSRIEIRDWLGAIGRRAWIVILIPALAAFAAAVNQIAAPTTYRSIATVTLVDVPTTGPLTAAVDQAVMDFQSAASSVGVLDLAAGNAEIDRDDVEISTRRVANGAVVAVVGVGGDPEATSDMVIEVAKEGQRAPVLVQQTVLEAQAVAQLGLVRRATQALRDEELRTGLTYSPEIVEGWSARYLDALDDQGAAQANGEDTSDEDERVERTQQRLADAQGLAVLAGELQARSQAWSATEIRLSQAQGSASGIASLTIPVSGPTELGRITPALRSALAAAVFGLLIALAIVAFLEVGTTRRRQRRETRTRVMEKQRRATVPERAAPRS